MGCVTVINNNCFGRLKTVITMNDEKSFKTYKCLGCGLFSWRDCILKYCTKNTYTGATLESV